MSRKVRCVNPVYDFSTGWEEIKPQIWQWIMWNEVGEKVIGWIVTIREEEFVDRRTGEVRTNQVCYMITPEKEAVRFIVPTDLRYKLETLNALLAQKKLGYDDVVVLIEYLGLEKTALGYNLKRFKVMRKLLHIPKDVKEAIPPLPVKGTEENEIEEMIEF